jgi:hypothetical protein
MATSYGYVERNLENDVNWGAVGKGFSDMLIAERDEREAKKASLDDAMMETQDGISKNAPLGYNTDFNDRMIDFASNSSSFVLAANKDLKAGRITPEDYMRKLQKINSSADTVFGLANNFNEWYDDKLKRMDSKESGVVEQATFEIMSKLVDFNKHDFFIDKSGMVVAAPLIKGEDGITRPDTANARSVQAIFNLAQNTVNRVDVDKTIQEKIKLLGKRVVSSEVAASYAKAGKQVTLEGLRYTDPDEYDKWKRAIIKEMTASDLDVASILGDYADEYEITGDAKTYDKNTQILLDLSEGKEVKVSLTENQKDRAFQVLSDAIDAQAGGSSVTKEIEKKEKGWDERRYGIDKAEGKKKLNDSVNMLGTLYAPKTEAQYKAAVSYFKGLSGGKIIDIVPSPGVGLTVVTKDGTQIPLPYDTDFNTWAKGSTILTGVEDITEALKRVDKSMMNVDKDGKYVINTGSVGNADQFKPTVASKMGQEIDATIVKSTDSNAVNNIKRYIDGLDPSLAADVKSSNTIEIIINKEGETKEFNISTEEGVTALKNLLKGDARINEKFKLREAAGGSGWGSDFNKGT